MRRKPPPSQTEKPSSPPKRPVSRRKQGSNSNRQTQIAGEMKCARLTDTRTRSVKHPAKGLDDRGNAVASPNSTFWSPECERVFQVSISGGWPDVDWLLIDKQPKYRVATNTFAFRAICGQRFGAVAPPGEECTNCRDGHGPFETCRIACLPEAPSPNGKKVIPAKALFAGSCMGCGLTGAGNKCSLRDPPEPKWVREYFVKEIPEHEVSIDLSRKLPLSPSPSTHGQEKKRQKLQTPASEPPSPRMTNTTETPQQSAILSPTTQRVSSTFTSNSQGEVKFLPSSGPRYTSPLNETGVFQNLQSLDRVLSEARLASERAAFDVRLLARRRDELIQKVNEDTEGYENIGGFADLIEAAPDIKPEMEK